MRLRFIAHCLFLLCLTMGIASCGSNSQNSSGNTLPTGTNTAGGGGSGSAPGSGGSGGSGSTPGGSGTGARLNPGSGGSGGSGSTPGGAEALVPRLVAGAEVLVLHREPATAEQNRSRLSPMWGRNR